MHFVCINSADHLKCQGGFPCEHCTRTNKTCIPPYKPPEKALVFVHDSRSKPLAFTEVSVPAEVPLDLQSHLSKHFFEAFMIANDFAVSASLDVAVIAKLRLGSSSLQIATMAIAALDASRNSQVLSPTEKMKAGELALGAYRKSVICLQKDIEDECVLRSDAFLWSTFFLGIFEVILHSTLHEKQPSGLTLGS